MSWLNASEYLLMETIVRDRVEELRAERARLTERVDASCPPSGWSPRSDASRGARAPHDGAAHGRAGRATIARSTLFCPGT